MVSVSLRYAFSQISSDLLLVVAGNESLVQRVLARGHDDRTKGDAKSDGQQVRTEAWLLHTDQQFLRWEARFGQEVAFCFAVG